MSYVLILLLVEINDLQKWPNMMQTPVLMQYANIKDLMTKIINLHVAILA